MKKNYQALSLLVPLCTAPPDIGALPTPVPVVEEPHTIATGSTVVQPVLISMESVRTESIVDALRSMVRDEISSLSEERATLAERMAALDAYIEENQTFMSKWLEKTKARRA